MYKSLTITVIIPCLNEEQGIEKVLRAMPEFVDEVIVVDNNSTTAPAIVALALGAKWCANRCADTAAVYKRGFAEATSDLIITPGRRSQLPGGRDLVPDRGVPAPGSGFPQRVAISGARPARHEPLNEIGNLAFPW